MRVTNKKDLVELKARMNAKDRQILQRALEKRGGKVFAGKNWKVSKNSNLEEVYIEYPISCVRIYSLTARAGKLVITRIENEVLR